ncbi:MAG: hypothetical protein E7316_09285 [Clostridiales bacterium]|nr:hypothetical protein [Clostridiales bacterium]
MKHNIKRTIGLIVLAALVIAAAILGVRVAGLVELTRIEMNTTPTPVPPTRNVMQVTIDPSAPTPQPVLRSGSQGEEVRQLQERLQQLGYYTSAVDGQFGPGTRNAVIAFQSQHGLAADGIVGEGTKAVLYSDAAQPKPTAPPTQVPTAVPEIAPAWVRSDGMPLLVNRDNPMPQGYQHMELVDMSSYCPGSIVKIKYSGTQAERVAVDALISMLKAAHTQGVTVWQVSAAYRGESYQQQLFDQQVQEYIDNNGLSYANAVSATRKTVLEPGYSEHHTGLAFDITVPGVAFKGTEQAEWLAANCWDYGFIIRYTEDKQEVTGILPEPWHIRYVGVEHSIPMHRQNLCLEEYIAVYGSN